MRKTPPTPAPDERPQLDKFRELARELGADEDEARFEVAAKSDSAPPKPNAPPKG